MRIWIAADISADSIGGVMRSLKETSVALKKRGHVVKIITRQKTGRGNYIGFSLQLGLRMMLAVFNRPDWIIARSTDGLACAMLSRLFGLNTRIALHSHGWEEFAFDIEKKMPRSVVNNPTSVKGLAIRFPLLRQALKSVHLVINGTLYETQRLKKKFPKHANKIVYLPNGTYPKPSAHWVENASRPFTFLAVGNSSWKKNIRHSLHVFELLKEKMPEAKMICAGTGVDDEAFGAVFGIAKPDGVINLPEVSFSDIDQWYCECPYLIFSSRYEGGHPFTLLEAMSNGLVVFAAPIPSVAEIVKDGESGFHIGALNAADDANTILSVIKKRSDLDSIRERAAEVAAEYDWKIVSASLEELLCRKA